MGFESAVFGIEKEDGKLNGILAVVYQNVFGQELYQASKKRRLIFSISLSKTILLPMAVNASERRSF